MIQMLRREQAGRKVARFLCAAWLFCILVATGASADVTIRGKQVWRNQKKTLSENIIIEDGASLTLEGATVHFKCTRPKQYGIVVKEGAGLIIRKGSVVRGETPLNGAFIYAEEGKRLRHVEARDSSFINIGTTIGVYRNAWQRPGIRLKRTDSTSGFWNCTFDGGPGIAAMWVSSLRIEGNTFRYKKQGNSVSGIGVFLDHCGPVRVHRNTFEGMKYSIYTQYTHDVQLTNNILKNCCYPYVKRGGYAMDLWGRPEKDCYVAFNRLLSVEKNIVLACAIIDGLFEYNYINNVKRHAYGTALGLGNTHNRRNVMRHNRSDNNRTSGGIITHPAYGLGLGRFLIYDSQLRNVRGAAGLMPICADMVFDNISFTIASDGGNWPGLNAIVSTKQKVRCERNLFRNLSFSKFRTGMQLQGARDCLFCDIRLEEIRRTHVQFDGGNSNLKFINLKFDSGRVGFKDGKDTFRPYWYADVLVTDTRGKPIQGAKVTVKNEVDEAVGAISRKGKPVSEFVTGKDGHTAKPGAAVRRTVTSKTFALKPDKPYKFAGWIRVKGDPGRKKREVDYNVNCWKNWDKSCAYYADYVKAYAILYELDQQGEPVAGHPLYVRWKSKWVLRKDSFTTLPQTRKGKVELFVYGWGDHAAWFDDLSVKGKDGKNLLTDPGFESRPGDGNWPAPDGHTAVLDGAERHSGKRSCKLVCRTWAAEDAGTMALCGYSQNKAGKTNYTYTITATKGNLRGSKTAVKPDANWYRADPTKAPVTIKITLR